MADAALPAVKPQPGTRPCIAVICLLHTITYPAAPVHLPAPATMSAAAHPRDCVQGVDGLADAALAQQQALGPAADPEPLSPS
jgi:hypothetical protein